MVNTIAHKNHFAFDFRAISRDSKFVHVLNDHFIFHGQHWCLANIFPLRHFEPLNDLLTFTALKNFPVMCFHIFFSPSYFLCMWDSIWMWWHWFSSFASFWLFCGALYISSCIVHRHLQHAYMLYVCIGCVSIDELGRFRIAFYCCETRQYLPCWISLTFKN